MKNLKRYVSPDGETIIDMDGTTNAVGTIFTVDAMGRIEHFGVYGKKQEAEDVFNALVNRIKRLSEHASV